ncbi:MAG: VCBS repeat-containing protein [Deltaproteobacteria bacterium]|nr:VCBS repeat-containing protein [Deltaproteobacteria bacterium]
MSIPRYPTGLSGRFARSITALAPVAWVVWACACGVVREPLPAGAAGGDPTATGTGDSGSLVVQAPLEGQVVGATVLVAVPSQLEPGASVEKLSLLCQGTPLGSQPVSADVGGQVSATFALTGLPEGPLVCTITAQAKKRARSAIRSLVVDRTPPVVTVVSAPQGPVLVQAQVQVKSTDLHLASVRIRSGDKVLAQAGALGNWAPTVVLPALPTGPATLHAEATDKAGNVQAVAVAIEVVAAPAFDSGVSPFMQAAGGTAATGGAATQAVPLMVDGHAADMDGDGHLDIVVATNQGITICYGNGKGVFDETPVYAGAAAHWVRAVPLPPAAVAGFSKDTPETGRWAVALIGTQEKVRVALVLAVGRKLALVAEHPLPGAKGRAELLAVDGTGILVAVMDSEAADALLRIVRIQPPKEVNWTNPGAATPGQSPVFTVKSQAGIGNVSRVRVADMDADGDLDLVFGRDGPSVVTVCLNDGNVHFTACKDALIAGETRPIDALPIVPKSGKGLDLLVAGYASASLFYLRNDGSGQFSVLSRAALATPPKGLYPMVATGVQPGQAGTQAAVVCEGNAVTSIALDDLANGANLDLTLACRAGRIASGQPSFAVVGDYNGDGLPDLVVANANEPGADLFDSNVAANQAYDYPLCLRHKAQKGMTPAGIAMGDFELDGKPDLLLVGSAAPSAKTACAGSSDPDNGPRDQVVPLELYRNVGYTGNKVPAYTEYAPNVDGVSAPGSVACAG